MAHARNVRWVEYIVRPVTNCFPKFYAFFFSICQHVLKLFSLSGSMYYNFTMTVPMTSSNQWFMFPSLQDYVGMMDGKSKICTQNLENLQTALVTQDWWLVHPTVNWHTRNQWSVRVFQYSSISVFKYRFSEYSYSLEFFDKFQV